MTVINSLWEKMLAFKAMLHHYDAATFVFGYTKKGDFLVLDYQETYPNVSYLLSDQPIELEGWISDEILAGRIYLTYQADQQNHTLSMLRLYWPLTVAPFFSKSPLPFILVHFAQTLDGKIATNTGDSKWIGNEENLIHAHRIRALVDGVLVGGNTIRTDLPKLSVRRVRGTNPARLFLTNTFNEWESLPEVENAKTILIREECKINGQTNYHNIDDVLKYEGLDDKTKIIDILTQLKGKGVHSILIEGGPKTTGSFIQAGVVNWIQIHIAPFVFGSGKSSMSLPEITTVDQAYHLKNVFYTRVNDAIMMTGELKKK